MATPDPALRALIEELAGVAKQPVQAIGQTLATLAVTFAAQADEQLALVESSDTREDVLRHSVNAAYAKGAQAAFEAIADAIFGGLAKVPRR